jgi:hypothetical protein
MKATSRLDVAPGFVPSRLRFNEQTTGMFAVIVAQMKRTMLCTYASFVIDEDGRPTLGMFWRHWEEKVVGQGLDLSFCS